jgi:hypothetical protein
VINEISAIAKTIDPPTRTPSITTNKPAIFDSGTTGHYILCDTACFNNRPTNHPLIVTLPNGEQIKSTHEATLSFPNLPKKTLEAHAFPGLNGQALVSIRTFCDAGCTALFTTTAVIITREGKVVLTGQQQPPGLWKKTSETTINSTLEPSNPWHANGAYTTQLRRNTIKFMHVAVSVQQQQRRQKRLILAIFNPGQDFQAHGPSTAARPARVLLCNMVSPCRGTAQDGPIRPRSEYCSQNGFLLAQ